MMYTLQSANGGAAIPDMGKLLGMADAHSRNLLLSVAHAAATLARAPHWREAITRIFEEVGVAAHAERTLLLRVRVRDDASGGDFSVVSEWSSERTGFAQANWSRLFRHMPVRGHGYDCTRWLQTLQAGDAFVVGSREGAPAEERMLLHFAQIKTALRVPMFVHGKLWGTVGFDNVTRERPWLDVEVLALWALARVLGAAIERAGPEAADAPQ